MEGEEKQHREHKANDVEDGVCEPTKSVSEELDDESTSQEPKELSREEQERKDAEDRAREEEEQAKLPYKWTQTIEKVEVMILIEGKYKARDFNIVIRRNSLKVAIKGQPPFIEGELAKPIIVDDSEWSMVETTESKKLGKGKELTVTLTKSNQMEWWAHVVTSAPKIDTSKIMPEATSMSDLKGDTRGFVEKFVTDNMNKQKENEEREKVLENFKKAHPEMDFSQAKISY